MNDGRECVSGSLAGEDIAHRLELVLLCRLVFRRLLCLSLQRLGRELGRSAISHETKSPDAVAYFEVEQGFCVSAAALDYSGGCSLSRALILSPDICFFTSVGRWMAKVTTLGGGDAGSDRLMGSGFRTRIRCHELSDVIRVYAPAHPTPNTSSAGTTSRPHSSALPAVLPFELVQTHLHSTRGVTPARPSRVTRVSQTGTSSPATLRPSPAPRPSDRPLPHVHVVRGSRRAFRSNGTLASLVVCGRAGSIPLCDVVSRWVSYQKSLDEADP